MSLKHTSVVAAGVLPAAPARLMLLALSLALALPLTARADETRFSSAEIRTMIIGKRIYLAAPVGGEFPLNYRRSGVVDGSGQASGFGRLAKPDDTGKWWIKNDQLCQQFTTWYKGAPMCFELYKTGATTLKWIRDNGQTGTARIGETI